MTEEKTVHSTEPWRVHGATIYAGETGVAHAYAEYFRELYGDAPERLPESEHEAWANADRIVACVNALRGVGDPEAFMLEIVGTLDRAFWYVRAFTEGCKAGALRPDAEALAGADAMEVQILKTMQLFGDDRRTEARTPDKDAAVCAQCGGRNTYPIEDPHQVVECMSDTWECRDCEESYSPATA